MNKTWAACFVTVVLFQFSMHWIVSSAFQSSEDLKTIWLEEGYKWKDARDQFHAKALKNFENVKSIKAELQHLRADHKRISDKVDESIAELGKINRLVKWMYSVVRTSKKLTIWPRDP